MTTAWLYYQTIKNLVHACLTFKATAIEELNYMWTVLTFYTDIKCTNNNQLNDNRFTATTNQTTAYLSILSNYAVFWA